MKDFKNETICVLYGSQTGNAQDLAERIWRESKHYYFNGKVCALDDYNILDLVNEKCVIIVCSTTGQGEEPDNMKHFWKFLLRKSLPSDSLTNLKFAVLGLGDSGYIKFNFVAKRLNKRLVQLGAEALIPVGLGDDQHDLGYDATADPWIESLWTNLLLIYPLPSGIKPLDRNTAIIPRWNVNTSKLCSNINSVQKQQSIYYSSRASTEFFVKVIDNIKTTAPDHFQDVRLIKLQTNGEKYIPGDVVVLRPRNLPETVKEFQRILIENAVDIPPETIFEISEINAEMPVPPHLIHKVTFQQLCEEYFDLTSIPRRHTFNILAQLTDSDLEKEKCLEFTTAEGQNDLYNYCNRPRRNITEVLEDFPHATKNITKEILFELLSPIKPRDFSIASSSNYHQNEIHILVAVVQYKTKLIKDRLGLCSNYLKNLKEGDDINVWIKKGSFKFPNNSDVPIIMVGPGTGVAPFRNYIFERLKNDTANSKNLILFFGCRGEKLDFHCKDEYLQLEKDNKLKLICAFSRDQEHKQYVQHKLNENACLIWEALATKNAYVFVAGSSKNMPQEVREAFVNICINQGNMTKDEAIDFIDCMEKNNHYQQETWS